MFQRCYLSDLDSSEMLALMHQGRDNFSKSTLVYPQTQILATMLDQENRLIFSTLNLLIRRYTFSTDLDELAVMLPVHIRA